MDKLVFRQTINSDFIMPGVKLILLCGLYAFLCIKAYAALTNQTTINSTVITLPQGPRFYVGGAFLPLLQDIAADKTVVPSDVGYWLHPMGLDAARKEGILPKLLSKFQKRFYAYEQDLDAWTDGSNPVQTKTPWIWGDLLVKNSRTSSGSGSGGGGKEWQCGLVAPWADSADIADPSKAIKKYKLLFDRMRSNGCQNTWIFWSPPSVPEIARKALQNRSWNRIFKAVGANGALVDHPAGRVDTLDVSFAFLEDARKAGFYTGWVFNGGDSAGETDLMMDLINKRLGALDVYAVDNFSKPWNGWTRVSRQLEAVRRKSSILKSL